MNILTCVVGAAESGKGTVCRYLAEQTGGLVYSSGDVIKDVFQSAYAHGQTDEWKEWACYTHEGKSAEHPYLRGYFFVTGWDSDELVEPRELYCLDHGQELDGGRLPGPVVSAPLTNREVQELIGDKILQLDPVAVMRPMAELAEEEGAPVFDESCRQEAQAEFVRSRGGLVIYCQRDEAESKAGTHHSATFYERTDHDLRVDNNGSLRQLYSQLDQIAKHIIDLNR